MQTYYLVLFLLSAALSGVYMFLWRRYFDVHITLIFTLIPIINLGFLLLAGATNAEAARIALKIAYMGGCFLLQMIMMTILSLCRIRVPRWLRMLFMALSAAIYLSVLTIGQRDWFYTGSFMEKTGSGYYLVREYGVMHSVFYLMVFAYFLTSLGAIIYSFARKRQVGRKALLLLFLPVNVCMVCYFFGRQIFPEIELSPVGYTFAQLCYLLIVFRLHQYNVADTAADNMVQNGNTAFISFDRRFNYLGSNGTAKMILPELDNLTVDLGLHRSKSLNELILPWLEHFRDDPDDMEGNRHFVEKGDRIYLFTVTALGGPGKEKGYEIVGTDDTLDRAYINLLSNYKKDLEAEVRQKTAHIVEMHDNLILSMAVMVESRDNSTGGHIRRTSEGVRILIDAIKETGAFTVTEDFCRNLIKAAPMHDLGKIAVDDAILRKPGRFEPEEFEVMKTHAAEGARIVHEILKATDDLAFHHLAENVAHFHHERWDGSGYPDRLAGEAIPLEARIMAVADVYDALVSKRVYKDSMSFEKADSIILEGMGSQFDPALEAVYTAARPKLEAYYGALDN